MRVDENDLPTLHAGDVGVREHSPGGEQCDLVLAVDGARQGVITEMRELVVDPGLLGQFAVGRGGGALPGLDPAADEAPPVRVDRRVLVALLEKHPAALVDESDESHESHAWRLATVSGVSASSGGLSSQ